MSPYYFPTSGPVWAEVESDPAIPFQRHAGTARFAFGPIAFMAVACKLNVAHVAAFDAFVGVEYQVTIHIIFQIILCISYKKNFT
jgi:hypothetical protein